MHILLIASAFNSLTQRVHAELRDRGHTVAVELRAARRRRCGTPSAGTGRDLVVAPMLKTAVPRDVWTAAHLPHRPPGTRRRPRPVLPGLGRPGGRRVLGRHGPPGRRGDGRRRRVGHGRLPVPSAARQERPVPRRGRRRGAGRRPARRRALRLRYVHARGRRTPRRRDQGPAATSARSTGGSTGRTDPTETVLRKLRAADSQPGVRDELLGGEWFLHGGHPRGPAARPAGRAARHPGRRGLPRHHRRRGVDPRTAPAPPRRGAGPPPSSCPPRWPSPAGSRHCRNVPAPLAPSDDRPPHLDRHPATGRRGSVGFLSFSFPGGAMSTAHCRRLLDAYRVRLLPPHLGAGPRRRPGLLLQRHPPQRHRGGRRPRRRVLGQHQRHGRPGGGRPDHHRPAGGRPLSAATRPRAGSCSPLPPTRSGAARASCSTRTTA